MTIMQKKEKPESARPCVHLVGAGPGDPELMTLRAARLISDAEVIVYDRLVSEAVLETVPTGVARIFVGKASACHAMPQSEINDLLVRLARGGHRVVRLKGGDPFVFGRGGEEAQHLRANGIACEVVPGVTAASACGAATGIPLTHRGLATGVRFVTGHCRDNDPLDLNWQSLADPDTTLVIYMGLANSRDITARLIAAGLAPDTPTAAIANGTLADQTVITSNLANLSERLVESGLVPPVTLIIGRVAALASRAGGPAESIEDAIVGRLVCR